MGKVAKQQKFTEEEFAELVRQSISFQELAGKIGYVKTSGSAIQALHKAVEERNLDTSHFLGQGWHKNHFDYSRFQYGKVLKTGTARNALAYKRGWKCEKCGLSEWLGEPITLEAHHIDGNRINNTEENLQLLCPNCHSQTDNYKIGNSHNLSKTSYVKDEILVESLNKHSSVRSALISVGLSGSGGNYARAYNLIDQYNIEHLKNNMGFHTPTGRGERPKPVIVSVQI